MSVTAFAQTTVTTSPPVKSVQANLDTFYITTTTKVVTTVASDTVIHKYVKPTPPVVVSANPGGVALTVLTYSNQSNINISNKTIAGKSLVFNNCNGVIVNLCQFNGLKGTNLYAVTFNNCTNVTCTNNFGTMYCKFVMVKGGSGINVSNNQYLNLYEPVIYNGDFAHAIQFNGVTGAGNKISNNNIENIQGQCINPHDIINLYGCSGTSTSHIIVTGNQIRGGMVQAVLISTGATGAGITLDNGNYIDVTNNKLVNPGCAAIQVNGTHTNILVDNNQGVSLISSKVAMDGIVALGGKTNVTLSNNKINWLKWNGATGTNYPGGEVLFWFGGSASPAGIKLINNTFDKTLTPSILPAIIITYHL